MASKEQEEMFITCKVCDMPFSIKVFEQHMKGKRHMKKVEDRKREMEIKSGDGDSSLENRDYTCGLCETAFTGIIPYSQHLKSKHHAKVTRRKEAEDVLENAGSDSEKTDDDDDNDAADLNEMAKKILPEPYRSCPICEKEFGGPESYSQHMKSKSHAKRKREFQLLKNLKAMITKGELSDSEEVPEGKKEDMGQGELKCEVCDKAFSVPLTFAQHVMSKGHKKRENQKKLLEDLEAIKMLELEEESSSSEDESEILTCEICKLAFSGPENLVAHISSKKHQKAKEWKKYLAKKSIKEGRKTQTSLEKETDQEKPSAENEIDSPEKSESKEKLSTTP